MHLLLPCLPSSSVQLNEGIQGIRASRPHPAWNIYTANLLHVTIGVVAVITVFSDAASALWHHGALCFQFAGLAYLPIAWVSFRTPKVNDELKSRSVIRRYDAEGVSYAFERTWSYYRKMAAFSTVIYWHWLNRVIRGVWLQGESFDAVSFFWFGDIAGITIATILWWWQGDDVQEQGRRFTRLRVSQDRHWSSSAIRRSQRHLRDRRCWRKTTAGLVIAALVGVRVLLQACGGAVARRSWVEGTKVGRETVAVQGKKEQ